MARVRRELRPLGTTANNAASSKSSLPSAASAPLKAVARGAPQKAPVGSRSRLPTTPPAREDAEPTVIDEPLTSDDDDDIEAQLAALDGRGGKGASRNGAASASTASATMPEDEGEFSGALTAERLRELTGVEDLDLVTGTELRVDATATCISIIGDLMPRLVSLRFVKSRIPTLRDLGTRLVQLQVLWANNCGVQSLSGIQFCHQLREAYFPFNSISDISSLGSLLNLEVVDLEGNDIAEAEQLAFLNGIEPLREVAFGGNPFVAAFESGSTYRRAVAAALDRCARLEAVDDVPVASDAAATDTQSTTPGATPVHVDPLSGDLSTELGVVTASIKVTSNVGIAALVEEQHRTLYSRQSTSVAGARRRPPSTAGRQLTPAESGHRVVCSAPTAHVTESPTKQARRVQSSDGMTPMRGAAVPSGAAGAANAHSPSGGAASALTQGSGVFSGNLTRNLRARRAGATAAGGNSVVSTPGGGAVRKSVLSSGPTSSMTVEEPGHRHRLQSALTSGNGSDSDENSDFDDSEQDSSSSCGADDEHPSRAVAPLHSVSAATAPRDRNGDADGDDDDDDDDIGTARRKLLDVPQPSLEFMTKYKDLIATTAAAEAGKPGDERRGLSTREIVAAVGDMKRSEAKLLQEQLLAETAGAGSHYESLQVGDLGGNVDDVL